jgi:hypothetical protein
MTEKHAPLEHAERDKTEAFVNWEFNLAGITFIVKEIGAKNLARRSKSLKFIVRKYVKNGEMVDRKRTVGWRFK